MKKRRKEKYTKESLNRLYELRSLERMVISEIERFAEKNNYKPESANDLINDYESDESQERLSDIMVRFVRLQMNHVSVLNLPPGEIGFVFMKYIETKLNLI
jgi:hypothetical protein